MSPLAIGAIASYVVLLLLMLAYGSNTVLLVVIHALNHHRAHPAPPPPDPGIRGRFRRHLPVLPQCPVLEGEVSAGTEENADRLDDLRRQQPKSELPGSCVVAGRTSIVEGQALARARGVLELPTSSAAGHGADWR
ncbi:MAG: hypothetical protein JRS35_22965 [Deltaproteobacteria bacterium]|nr:hypothetical protein [Deltaproteobacteria bacterium]MBW2254430.1 hypothetical protein [Deltaproteobacteria bacterium]